MLVVGREVAARAAAIQVAENPGTAYNPLFIYGGVGLGKTHLVHAVGNALLRDRPDARVLYLHAEQFISDVVKNYQRKTFDELKAKYHSLDLLLIDDVQFLAGKERIQEEFFHTFNDLFESQRQIVLSSDRPVTEIATTCSAGKTPPSIARAPRAISRTVSSLTAPTTSTR